MSKKIHHTLIIPDELYNHRLDQALAKCLPAYSRTQIQEWIKNGEVSVNTHLPRPRDLVKGGEKIIIEASLKPQPRYEAQFIQLDIIYEDDAILVVNKPPGLVVHPAVGNVDHTLLNALLHYHPKIQSLPRAGIVHRLDKDTSGLLVIAKNEIAYKSLTKQLKARTISRIYQAVIWGVLTSGGTIDKPIGRHPIHRRRMTVIETGKPALTHYRVIERYRAHTRVKVILQTGRTHQIRVHMAAIYHPILGDQTYGGRLQLPKNATPALIDILRQFKRQALHASELTLTHPVTHIQMTWNAPLPEDMHKLMEILRQDSKISFL